MTKRGRFNANVTRTGDGKIDQVALKSAADKAKFQANGRPVKVYRHRGPNV